MLIRAENENDRDAVHAINASAFPTSAEAGLVNALRDQAQPIISLVAEDAGEVVGHIMFSPVSLDGASELKIMGLAPMAVLPNHQCKGIGTALVNAGLDQCKNSGTSAVVVLGQADYYPRFGFSPSSKFDIKSEYDVPEEVFMALELLPDALSCKTGLVKYHDAFSKL